MQVPEKDKELIHRHRHGAAAVTVNSDCVEVILFGGRKELRLPVIVGTEYGSDRMT